MWLRSALNFETKGYNVYAITRYQSHNLNRLSKDTFIYKNYYQLSRKERLLRKFRLKKDFGNPLCNYIKKIQPHLVIISQGSNMSSLEVMDFCYNAGLKFVTITQLVTESHFSVFNNENLEKFRFLYSSALLNFFVSQQNLELNNCMLGIDLKNALTTYNPCRVYGANAVDYPSSDIYNIALVSRINFFHKGHDLLLKALQAEKWKKRNVRFNIYGDGPNHFLIKDIINNSGFTNVSLQGYSEDMRTVWQNNHLLCMPSRFEGQALALIEAMYFGRAAVVTNVGGIKELVRNEINGFIAETASAESIDKALEKAWEKRNMWESMGIISRKMILKKYKIPAEIALNNHLLSLINKPD